MPRTRAQAHAEDDTSTASLNEPTAKERQVQTKKNTENNRKQPNDTGPDGKRNQSRSSTTPRKRAQRKADSPNKRQKLAVTRADKSKTTTTPQESSKLDAFIQKNGFMPLSGLGLKDPESPTAETVLAHIFNALLSSGRIGHSIAHKTLQCLIDAKYHQHETLKKSSWEERTQVLTEGGYTHYREKTSTFLGELVDLIETQYDGDPAKILPSEEEAEDATAAQKMMMQRIKEIKGLGKLGVDILLGTIQTVFAGVAPFVGKRDREKAEELGLGNVEEMWSGVGKNHMSMGVLSAALTKARLEGIRSLD